MWSYCHQYVLVRLTIKSAEYQERKKDRQKKEGAVLCTTTLGTIGIRYGFINEHFGVWVYSRSNILHLSRRNVHVQSRFVKQFRKKHVACGM